MSQSREFWNSAAKENAAWYIATGHVAETEDFFQQGAKEVDDFLGKFNIEIRPTDVVLEIGCGVGRMTRRLSELSSQVIGADVSDEMLDRARVNLANFPNTQLMLLPGDGNLPDVNDASVDFIFSYITLQHIANKTHQIRYIHEAARVLAPGGRMLIQIRRSSAAVWMHEWTGHIMHLLARRKTLNRQWRGNRLNQSEIVSAIEPFRGRVKVEPLGMRHLWLVCRG